MLSPVWQEGSFTFVREKPRDRNPERNESWPPEHVEFNVTYVASMHEGFAPPVGPERAWKRPESWRHRSVSWVRPAPFLPAPCPVGWITAPEIAQTTRAGFSKQAHTHSARDTWPCRNDDGRNAPRTLRLPGVSWRSLPSIGTPCWSAIQPFCVETRVHSHTPLRGFCCRFSRSSCSWRPGNAGSFARPLPNGNR